VSAVRLERRSSGHAPLVGSVHALSRNGWLGIRRTSHVLRNRIKPAYSIWVLAGVIARDVASGAGGSFRPVALVDGVNVVVLRAGLADLGIEYFSLR
jgi:hypothetical protein